MSTALFVGRFQPFHRGHLEMVKDISKKYSKIIIVIGSTQEKDTYINPFSADEREQMVNLALSKENIKNYETVKVPDIFDNSKWVEHVKAYTGEFNDVYTGSKLTKSLFEKSGYNVFDIKERIKGISGSEIRLRMAKEMEWEELVPQIVAEYIEKIHGAERVKALTQGE